MIVHVVPINDILDHDLATACDCCPDVEVCEVTGHLLATHHSYDRREEEETIGSPGAPAWAVYRE